MRFFERLTSGLSVRRADACVVCGVGSAVEVQSEALARGESHWYQRFPVPTALAYLRNPYERQREWRHDGWA